MTIFAMTIVTPYTDESVHPIRIKQCDVHSTPGHPVCARFFLSRDISRASDKDLELEKRF
jgi:hypothetical protein